MNPRTIVLLYGLLALVGLADAAYLTWDHYQHLVDPSFGGGLCGEGGGCDISRTSAASEIPLGGLGPGLPISILAMAFYLAFAALAAVRLRRPDDRRPRRLLVGLAALATAYSLALLALSLIVQGSLCELCSILYAVNLALLVVAWRDLGDPPLTWLREVWAALPSRGAAVAAVTFVVVATAAYVVYASGVRANVGVLDAPTQVVETDARPAVGPVDAPVQIVEFADFQCPHCSALFETLEAVQKARPNEVRVTFMHFPLDKACNPRMERDFHMQACALAYVADCAGQQGKFFEVAEQVFKLGRGASREAALAIAADHGLDARRMAACVDDPATHARVLADIEQGIALGVTGTPAFFVNGRRVVGARPRATIDSMIDDVLAARRE